MCSFRMSKMTSRIGTTVRATHALCARWIRDTRASSIMELALLVPIFSAFVIGAAQFGLLCYTSIEISEAARAGVAYGAQSSTKAADTTGMQTAATNAAPNIAGMTATASQFWVCSNSMTYHYTAAPTCSTGYHSIHYVQVNTSVAANPPFHLSEHPTSFTLTGLAIMRVL